VTLPELCLQVTERGHRLGWVRLLGERPEATVGCIGQFDRIHAEFSRLSQVVEGGGSTHGRLR